jgi:hypothetical protein
MKYKLLTFIFSLFLVLFACDEIHVSVFPVVSIEYATQNKDSVIVDVETAGALIELKGFVEITEGECVLLMRNPEMDTIYTQTYIDPGKHKVNTSFLRTTGEWTFIYQTLMIEDVQPRGSIDLVISYKE